MHTIPLNLTAAHAQRLEDAFGEWYEETVEGEPNTETRPAFAKRMMLEYIRSFVVNKEHQKAKIAAIQSISSIEIT